MFLAQLPITNDLPVADHVVAYKAVLLAYWPVFVIALAVSLVLTPVCRRIALAKGIVDRPDDWLKPHKKPIP